MERAALAARVDFALPMTDAKMRPVLLESLPDFVCPADDEFQRLTPVPHKKTDVLLATIASANYVASSGTFRLSCGACRDYFDGMFGRNKAVRPSEVEDGLSQTLAAGERAFKWSSPVIWGNVPESKLVDRQVPRKFAAGPGYVLGTTFAVGFNVPTPIYDVNEQDSSAEGFGSRHLGGANFVFCDGSARFMRNETMDPAVFNSLSTRAGGAVTTDLLLTGGEE
jgi:prepilin-type processing-associated H-X9-DG protein